MKIGVRVWAKFLIDLPVRHSLPTYTQVVDVEVEVMGVAWFYTGVIIELQQRNYLGEQQEVDAFQHWLTSQESSLRAIQECGYVEWPLLDGIADLRDSGSVGLDLEIDAPGFFLASDGRTLVAESELI